MTQSDESFRNEFKPLSIPASYETADTQESKIIFALAQLGEGNSEEVLAKLDELQPGSIDPQLAAMTEVVLSGLFDKGLIKGTDHRGKMSYNLSKITESNEGEVDPNLLAPGLD